jgi:hypothetical protein
MVCKFASLSRGICLVSGRFLPSRLALLSSWHRGSLQLHILRRRAGYRYPRRRRSLLQRLLGTLPCEPIACSKHLPCTAWPRRCCSCPTRRVCLSKQAMEQGQVVLLALVMCLACTHPQSVCHTSQRKTPISVAVISCQEAQTTDSSSKKWCSPGSEPAMLDACCPSRACRPGSRFTSACGCPDAAPAPVCIWPTTWDHVSHLLEDILSSMYSGCSYRHLLNPK